MSTNDEARHPVADPLPNGVSRPYQSAASRATTAVLAKSVTPA
jgi:hypothetical protein